MQDKPLISQHHPYPRNHWFSHLWFWEQVICWTCERVIRAHKFEENQQVLGSWSHPSLYSPQWQWLWLRSFWVRILRLSSQLWHPQSFLQDWAWQWQSHRVSHWMSQITHLHFLKPDSKHLQFGVLDLLGSPICSLENFLCLFSGLHMRDPMKFINKNTIENSFAIGICQSKGSLVPLRLGCCWSHLTILNGIPNGLINRI